MKYNYKDFLQIKRKVKEPVKVQIVSGSMEPWILTGETITAEPCDPSELEPFDIIVFFGANKLICHIYIDMEEDFLITRPLSEHILDPPRHKTNLLGKVIDPKFKWYHRLLLKWSLRNKIKSEF